MFNNNAFKVIRKKSAEFDLMVSNEVSVLEHFKEKVDVKVKFHYDILTHIIYLVEHQRLDQISNQLNNEIDKLTKQLEEIKYLDKQLDIGSEYIENMFEKLKHLEEIKNISQDEFFIRINFETYKESFTVEKNVHQLVHELNPKIHIIIKKLKWIKLILKEKNRRKLVLRKSDILTRLNGIKIELGNIIIISESIHNFEKILKKIKNNEHLVEKFIKQKETKRRDVA